MLPRPGISVSEVSFSYTEKGTTDLIPSPWPEKKSPRRPRLATHLLEMTYKYSYTC